MLIYYFGNLYYSAPVVWLTAFYVLAAAPAIALGMQHLARTLEPASFEVLLVVADHALAATLVSGALWHLVTYSCTPGYLHGDRAELLVLRAASALLTACGATCLVAQLLPRGVLAALAALYVGLSLNLACWCSAAWLHLQEDGLSAVLPAGIVRALRHERPIEWLRSAFLSTLVHHARTCVPLLFVADADLPHAMSIVHSRLRTFLEQPGMVHSLPRAARELLLPWKAGSAWVRVHHVSVPALVANVSVSREGRGINGAASDSGINGAASSTNGHHGLSPTRLGARTLAYAPAPAPVPAASAASGLFAPEWLLMYVVRRQATRALLGERAANLLQARGAAIAAAGLAAGLGAMLLKRRLLGGRRARQRDRLLPAAAVAAALAAGYLVLRQRRRERERAC